MIRKLTVALSLFTIAGTTALALASDSASACEHGGKDRAAFRQKMLEKFDANHDGVLDDAERAAAKAARVEHVFQKLDANRDGQLSADEVQGHRLEQRFAEIDTDHSGAISKPEMLAAKMHHKKHHGEQAMRRVLKVRHARV